VPHRYAFNDTNDGYTDPNLPWTDWENALDLMALHGINEVCVTAGTDYVYYLLMQRYGYRPDEVRAWIPDPAHQPWWILQNMSGGDFPVSEALLQKRAALGRAIADRARELGITPVFPGYWGTVPTDFANRNVGADVIAQDIWAGYQRPGWLNPATALFQRVAADYYAISAQVLGASTMYKMDPLHEGGVQGHADLTQSASAIEAALQTAHPGATWVILAWMANPSPALLAGVTDKSRLLLLAAEADAYQSWDSAQRWPGVPYAFGSIYGYGGRTILGSNAATMVDRWFSDLAGANSADLRGVAVFPESWTTNPATAELLSELPWQPARFNLGDWLKSYAIGRYGGADPHALAAWTMLASTVYATPPDGTGKAQDSLFNAQPALTVASATCCYERMRYSGPDFEKAWKELLVAAPGITQTGSYQFDLADATRQVVVNRARVLLPLIRHAYDLRDAVQFSILSQRWLALMDLADRVEGTNASFMLGPHLDTARAVASTPEERVQFVRNALNLITNWGTLAGYEAGLRDYANRDWDCLTRTYYKARWSRYFDSLRSDLAGQPTGAIDWYRMGEDFANGDHADCASSPSGDIVQIAQEVGAALDVGPEASVVGDDWSSYSENDARFSMDGARLTIESAGADLWLGRNRFGTLYQRSAMRDGMIATVHVASMQSQSARPWARAGIIAGENLVDANPRGFVNIAITPGQGCVFSWAPDPTTGLSMYTQIAAITAPAWVRLTRAGTSYVGSCSADGQHWMIAGAAAPGGIGSVADVGVFATAANDGASDRLTAYFDTWTFGSAPMTSGSALAIEYFHARFGHYFMTANGDEIAKLDAGVFEGWARTGQAFQVFTQPALGRVPVCRFFTVAFPPTSSHFYGPRGFGCEGALANPDWLFEGEVFYAALPDVGGTCGMGSVPVYRLYNNGQGGAPNHRFTTSVVIRDRMVAQGFVPEGAGVGVGMCEAE
jgi:hypothetical protein